MINQQMETLISKYLTNTLTNEEAHELNSWVKDKNNRKVFEDYVGINFITEKDAIQGANKENEAWDMFKAKLKKQKNANNYIKYAVAASIILLISLPFIFNKKTIDNQNKIVNNNIEVGSDKAILTLEDGNTIVLQAGSVYNGDYVRGNGKTLVYEKSREVEKEKIVYNYLTVPRGGQFFVELPDGTKVWLNSESQLKYPIHFMEGNDRKVELVYGEAYFDVSPSTKHKGAKFKVFTKGQEVEVLGTEFNIKAYQDETLVYTTLVEGKVSVGNKKSHRELIPSEQSILDIDNQHIKVVKLNKVYDEVAWKHGEFSFREMPLKDIMKVLSRWYDTKVVFVNKNIENELFTGILGKEQSIEEILSIIYNMNDITYTIDNKTIIFK